ncbi:MULTISPECIES: FecCD family ABC transporter permease [Pseudovibrio]|uniref:FecCD family ABC transporter permease n=1 Tax=Stappiaceae TaxID=2821832 RepID=UPI0023664DE7|nr:MULTISPECIES: iron ABC transporter permease [Pseudovibrio]MDD7909613.1 iron ABC transporter permease [Pseudovibrio exalbescens]MDX5591939.1 iron ABC transporter permease [Pseudovibrio sp. SPO723]
MNLRIPYALLVALLGLAVLCAFVGSLSVGPAQIPFTEGIAALFADDGNPVAVVMQDIRLPRAVLAVLIGISLGLSGAVLQGYLRNPLAEPGLIGVSSTASLGAVIAIYTGLSVAFPLALPLMALMGAAIAGALLNGLAGQRGHTLTLILAGVAISSIATALTSLALNLSPNPFAAMEIVFWMLGSLEDRSMQHVWLALPLMVVGWIMMLSLGRALDALTIGEEAAMTLGVNLKRLSFIAIIGTAASVGAATAVAGAIGFVGLVVPHLMRGLVGHQPSKLLLPSALGGAIMLTVADIGVRIITPQSGLKLGVLTALVGAPFFLWLILAKRRSML